MKKPKARLFDGKRFKWMGWAESKRKASERKHSLTKKGYRVRVVKTKPSKVYTQVYDIYGRRV